MAVGDEAKVGLRSYVAVGKETTFGTYASATTAIDVLSFNFRVERPSLKLDTLHNKRSYGHRVVTMQEVGGSLEGHLHPHESVLVVATAMGGGIATTSLTGSAYRHSIASGNITDTSPVALSFNVRKGDTHTWRYLGGRPNVVTIAATVGEPVKLTAEFIFRDATQLSDDISAILSISTVAPFVYHQGRFIYASAESQFTTTSAEPIQSFELTINNNIVSDEPARQLGSLLPTVLPPTRREVTLKTTSRFDTTTTYNRFIQATEGAVRIEFTGTSINSEYFYSWQIDIPKVFVASSDPEVGGASEVLQVETNYDVLDSNPNTTTGRDIAMTVLNATVSY